MLRRSSSPARALLAVASLCTVVVGGCTLLFAGGKDVVLCDRTADCADGARCVSGFCKSDGTAPPADDDAGEGEGEGEGEGSIAEGEGEGGAAEGEGEGEGSIAEGEGEAPPRTCKQLRALDAGLPSGTYAIDINGDGAIGVVHVGPVAGGFDHDEATTFCDMSRNGGGWTLIANVVGMQAQGDCPTGLTFTTLSGTGATALNGCARPTSAGGSSVGFRAVALHPYNEVLGRAEAIVFGDGDAFGGTGRSTSIDGLYVDGISVTVGTPRTHVFTFVAAHPLEADNTPTACPCRGGTAAPAFVGSGFFCDKPSAAARPGTNNAQRAFDPANPLWDATMVCAAGSVDGTYFKKTLADVQAGDLEVRVMDDQGTDDENLALTRLELYIR